MSVPSRSMFSTKDIIDPAAAKLELLLNFYNNEDLILGEMLRNSLSLSAKEHITTENLKKYIADSNGSADTETIERTLTLAKIFVLLHTKSPDTYKLPQDIKTAIARDIKQKITTKQAAVQLAYPEHNYPQNLINAQAEEHDNYLFSYLQLPQVLSNAELNSVYEQINLKYKNSYSAQPKFAYVNNGKMPEKPENALQDGIKSLGDMVKKSFLDLALDNKEQPKDRAIAEKDFLIDPKSNSLAKILDTEQREQIIAKLALLNSLTPPTGPELCRKFNTSMRNLLEEYRPAYINGNETKKAEFISRMNLRVAKLAAVLRQNGQTDAANDLLKNMKINNAVDDGLLNVFKKKSLLPVEEVTKKTKEFYDKFKGLLASKNIAQILHGDNRPLNKKIADYINSKPILEDTLKFGKNVEDHPDILEARRKFANRLGKLRLALLNYEMVADATDKIGGTDNLAPDVAPMNILFDDFKKHYDKLQERIDPQVRAGKPKKYFEAEKLGADRKTELDKLADKLKAMQTNVGLREKHYKGLTQRVKTTQREGKVVTSEELKEAESAPKKLQDIAALKAKMATLNAHLQKSNKQPESGGMFSWLNKVEDKPKAPIINSADVMEARKQEKECDELFAKTVPPKSPNPQMQPGMQQYPGQPNPGSNGEGNQEQEEAGHENNGPSP